MSFLELYNSVLNTNATSESLPYPVHQIHFKKGDFITRYGQVEESLYFINSGVAEMTIRSYMTEKIIDFFFANEMFNSFTSFLTQNPSDVQLKALTDCEMEVIAHADLLRAYETSPEANKLSRILLEQIYLRKAKREKDLLVRTAEERYAEMFRTHSLYIAQIPVNKIAKYLGIHPESLSRIRRKLNS